MPAFQVRDFPEDLYEQLRAYAAANHRSMAQQTIIAVEQMINGAGGTEGAAENNAGVIINFDTEAKRRARIKKYKELFERIDASNARIIEKHGSLPDISTEQIVQWIREDRDNNHGHEINLALASAEA